MLIKHTLHLVRRERDQRDCDLKTLAQAIAADPSIPNDPKMGRDHLAQLMGEEGAWVDVLHIHPLDETEDGPRHEEVARLVVGYGRETLKQDPICHCVYEDGSVEKVSIDLDAVEKRHKAYLGDQARAAAFRAQQEIDAHQQAIDHAETTIAKAAEMAAVRKAKEAEAQAAAATMKSRT